MLVITEQIIRDHLFFKGPLSLGEIASLVCADKEDRSNLLVMLNRLQDKGQAVFDTDSGTWRSLVALS